MNKFVVTVFIVMGLVALGPKEEARADALTGALIGAGIGALAGLIFAAVTAPSGKNNQPVSLTNAGGSANQGQKKNKWDERGN